MKAFSAVLRCKTARASLKGKRDFSRYLHDVARLFPRAKSLLRVRLLSLRTTAEGSVVRRPPDSG